MRSLKRIKRNSEGKGRKIFQKPREKRMPREGFACDTLPTAGWLPQTIPTLSALTTSLQQFLYSQAQPCDRLQPMSCGKMSAGSFQKRIFFPNEGRMQRGNLCLMLLSASCLEMQLYENVMHGSNQLVTKRGRSEELEKLTQRLVFFFFCEI